MIHNNVIVDSLTQRLLNYENKLFAAENTVEFKIYITKLFEEIQSNDIVRTSRELDYYLQSVLMYLSASLQELDSNKSQNYKLAIVIRNNNHNVLVVKPSAYYRGRCISQHPSMGLEIPKLGRIGQTRLSLLQNKLLYCGNFEINNTCPNYIPLDAPSEERKGKETKSVLCIPLIDDFDNNVIKYIRTLKELNNNKNNKLCSLSNCNENTLYNKNNKNAVAVIDIESYEKYISPIKYSKFLENTNVIQILKHTKNTLVKYPERRNQYKTQKCCTAFFDFAHRNLQDREMYETLLGAVSDACDNADVSFHVRDLPSDKNRDRCIRLVEGVGNNFRGFLINDRHSTDYGVVGCVFRKGKEKVISEKEISDAINNVESKKFRELMIGTVLEIAVPVFAWGGKEPVAVLNVEWDRKSLDNAILNKDLIEDYIIKKTRLLNKFAAYMSLVVQQIWAKQRYNRFLSESNLQGEMIDNLCYEGDRRLQLSYYLRNTLENINTENQLDNSITGDEKYWFLRHIIDAAGYLLSAQSDLQFSLAFRSVDKNILCLATRPHGWGLVGEGRWGHGQPADDIKIKDKSVTGCAVYYKVAIFGEVKKNDESFILDSLCSDSLKLINNKEIHPKIKYKKSGIDNTIYEVAVPVWFGSKILGVLDFEQFTEEVLTDEQRREVLTKVKLTENKLNEFYEWARAVSFSIAFESDLRNYEKELIKHTNSNNVRIAYNRFKEIAALVVGNVELKDETAKKISENYLRMLIPAEKIWVVLFSDKKSNLMLKEIAEEQRAGHNIVLQRMKLSGATIGIVVTKLKKNTKKIDNSVFPSSGIALEESESLLMALRLYAGYRSSGLFYPKPGQKESEIFKAWIVSAKAKFHEMADKYFKNKGNDRDGGQRIIDILNLAHLSLKSAQKESFPTSNETLMSQYGWYIYHTEWGDSSKAGKTKCSNRLVTISNNKPRVSMRTEELHVIAKEVLESGNARRRLEQLLRSSEYLKNEDWFNEIAKIQGGDLVGLLDQQGKINIKRDMDSDDIKRIIEYVLGNCSYEIDTSVRSITVRTARTGVRQCIPNVKLSPYRSSRPVTDWIFDKQPYSLVSIPIKLRTRANIQPLIGVINILRRRERALDSLFFKSWEVTCVSELVTAIEDVLSAEIHVESLPANNNADGKILAGPIAFHIEKSIQSLKNSTNEKQIDHIVSNMANDVRQIQIICKKCGVELITSKSNMKYSLSKVNNTVAFILPLSDIPINDSTKNHQSFIDENFNNNKIRNAIVITSIENADWTSEAIAVWRRKITKIDNEDRNWNTFLKSWPKNNNICDPDKAESHLVSSCTGKYKWEEFKKYLSGNSSKIIASIGILETINELEGKYGPFPYSVVCGNMLLHKLKED